MDKGLVRMYESGKSVNMGIASVVSTNNVTDGEAFGDILDVIESDIKTVSADGAYDRRKCYDKLEKWGVQGPSSKNSGFWVTLPWQNKPSIFDGLRSTSSQLVQTMLVEIA